MGISLAPLDYDDPLALLEEDSSGEGARRVLLVVDWGGRRIYAETRDSTAETIPEYRHLGHETVYSLPSRVNAAELREWVEEAILPLARPLFDAYERQWDGDNWIGAFPGHEHEKEDFDDDMTHMQPPLLRGEGAGLWPVEEWLVDVPEDLTAGTTDEGLRALAGGLIAEARREQIVLVGNVPQYLEEMREELREVTPSPDVYQIEGYEVLEKTVKSHSNTAHVLVPRKYVGARVKIVICDPVPRD